jgi:hypothetical protein
VYSAERPKGGNAARDEVATSDGIGNMFFHPLCK